MRNVILDTNILFSALFWAGNEKRCWDVVCAGVVENHISQDILEELYDVVRRKTPLDVHEAAEDFLNESVFWHLEPVDRTDDEHVLALAQKTGACIVTGDRELRTQGLQALTTRQLLEQLTPTR